MKKALLLSVAFLSLTSCMNQRSDRGEYLKPETIHYPIPEGGEVFYESHGKEEWFAYGAMHGVDDTPANGVAQAHSFTDGFYLHTIQLNIDLPPDGYFYEGWILNGDDIVSTGHLSNYFGDTRYSLRFEADDADYRDYVEVLVTLEPDDGNPAPAEHVSEGVMRMTKRK